MHALQWDGVVWQKRTLYTIFKISPYTLTCSDQKFVILSVQNLWLDPWTIEFSIRANRQTIQNIEYRYKFGNNFSKCSWTLTNNSTQQNLYENLLMCFQQVFIPFYFKNFFVRLNSKIIRKWVLMCTIRCLFHNLRSYVVRDEMP